MPEPFAAALSLGDDWREVAEALGSRLAGAAGQLGLLYTAEPFAPHQGEMLDILRQRTGAPDWVSAAGYGVIAAGEEHYGEPGASALLLDLPPNSYRLFAGGREAGADLASRDPEWLAAAAMPLALTHVDPRDPGAAGGGPGPGAAPARCGGGARPPPATRAPHQAGGATGVLSGVALSPAAIEIATALSQGCTPLGRNHVVTRGKDNLLFELDGRRALDVFREDIGEELASDLRRVGGLIFAALPVAGSDTADYTVRNLVGIDPESGVIAIGEVVPEGGKVLFCRRDRETAVGDMRRMTEDLKRRVGDRVIRGGVYVSCAARGPNQFEPPESETEIIRDTLGAFPMVGFFANGELNRDRIYAYTGVLTLFL